VVLLQDGHVSILYELRLVSPGRRHREALPRKTKGDFKMTYEQALEWAYETAFKFAGPDGPDNRKTMLALRDRMMADAKDRADWRKGVDLISAALGEKHLCCVSLAEKALELRAFAVMIRDDFDCDNDAHKYGTPCRACEAEKLVGKKTP
jgi:hypothetical protein